MIKKMLLFLLVTYPGPPRPTPLKTYPHYINTKAGYLIELGKKPRQKSIAQSGTFPQFTQLGFCAMMDLCLLINSTQKIPRLLFYKGVAFFVILRQ